MALLPWWRCLLIGRTNMFNKHLLCCALAAVALMTNPASAAVSASEAAKLGDSLTPLGAEKSGNADGSIPEWTGGLTQAPAGYQPGMHHIDPFAGDQPLFTITKDNLAQYKDKLSVGQIALFDSYPSTFRMPVYQTRRTGASPQWVYDNTKKNATTAKLVDGGNGFSDAFGGIPFPMPQNGLEAIWNHIARFKGTYLKTRISNAVVQQSGAVSLSSSVQEVKYKYYEPDGSFQGLNNLLFLYSSTSLAPARFAGEASLVHETINQVTEPRKAWAYSPGQRRVRRAPTLGYDTPTGASEGIQTTDNVDMFNGAPDRYEWKLVGKKEIYIPYNNYRMSAAGVKYKDLLQPGHLDQQLARFELHRVWVVEATLKPGARHIYSKRTFYLDEDSWQIVLIDQYDSRGDLWRVAMAYLKNFYDLPTTWAALEAIYDLQSRRYMVTNMTSEEEKDVEFFLPVPDDKSFEPVSLRRRGVR
jgi:hypothetical protein